MKINEIILEYRGGSWREIRALAPKHWPDYVVKDMLYNKLQNVDDLQARRINMEWILRNYPVKRWRKETRDFTLNSFDSRTQYSLKQRMDPEFDTHGFVPRDRERHEIQQQLIAQRGAANQEPIIVIQWPAGSGVVGLELIEGWHRTVQNAKAFPDGWRGTAWVGYV